MPKIEIKKSMKLVQRTSYPFDELSVGQGFVVHDPTLERSIRAQASKHGRSNKKKFTVRLGKDTVSVKRLK